MKRSGLICVSIMADDMAGVMAVTRPILPLIDLVEVRLDSIKSPVMDDWPNRIGRPVLATNRPVWEGGQFVGTEEERIIQLCQAVRAGAQYVDIELRTDQGLRQMVQEEAEKYGAQLILSYHDFAVTPDDWVLEGILQQMMAEKGKIAGKIITTARTSGDVLRVLALQKQAMAAGFPLSAFAMGTIGRISRLATLYLGGFMTYVAPDAVSATAPGQLSIHDLHAIMGLLQGEA